MNNSKLLMLLTTVATALASFPKMGDSYLVSQEDGTQYNADASAINGCGHVIVWESRGSQGSGIKGQLYDCESSKKGSEITIQADTEGTHRNPSVTTLVDGFVVVWDGPTHILSKKFDYSGFVIAEESLVHPNNPSTGSHPSVSSSGSGYLVVWERPSASEGSGNMQFFNSDTTISTQVLQFGPVEESQLQPQAASLLSGGVIVTWCSNNFQSGHWQRFNNDGTSLSPITQITSSSADFKSLSQIAVTGMQVGGGFAMTWSENHNSKSVLHLEVFDEQMTSVSNVVVAEESNGVKPVIASSQEGIIVVWTHPAQGTDSSYVTSSQEFDNNGVVVESKVDISSPSTVQQNPRISSHTIGYVVTWEASETHQEQPQQQPEQQEVSFDVYATNYGYSESWGSRNLIFIFAFTLTTFCICSIALYFVWRSCNGDIEESNA
eukprot:TRINITY_DN20247_c0_g1_i1.p1 TRINITY_DN20247_c0_g1~~TRINITY_DN20247_c0_g1_i1.p1  ORF type:complete len:456 (+),score=96.95 TRINITY_DN20247_c0_g1_i1:61-1368(+)